MCASVQPELPMTLVRHASAALAALVLFACAAPAMAAIKGPCLWKNLSAVRRTSMLDEYRAKGLASLSDTQFEESDIPPLQKHCPFKDDEAEKVGQVIGSMLLETGSDLVLFEQYGVRKGSLNRQWKALPAADRKGIADLALAIMSDEKTDNSRFLEIAEAVQAKLGADDPKVQDHVIAYLVGRGLREAREAGR
jgi:hypothetical protein